MKKKSPYEIINCKHEIDPATAKYNKRYGRSGYCKYCGCKVVVTKWIEPKKTKEVNNG